MHMPDEADDWSNEHLDAADDEQPRTGCHKLGGEEHEAADEEPDADEDIVDDAQHLIPLSDDEFVMADVQSRSRS